LAVLVSSLCMLSSLPTSPLFPYTTLFRSMYRHKLNATNIVQEVDANELWTYAKGYGNYGNEGEGEGGTSEWQDAKLIREYTSPLDRKSTRLNSSHVSISYAVFCLKKKTNR